MQLTTLLRTLVLCLPLALYAQTGYDIALTGDMPYAAAAEPLYERVIADINRQNVDFTVHIGDTKNGSTRCDDSHYVKVLNWFNSFDKAMIYSVGDNEWTDCLRVSNGAYDPIGRLDLIRKTYFATNLSLGRRPIALQRQSDDPKYSLYVENSMLVKAPVVFATIHIPGSNNNLEYKIVQGSPNKFYDNDKEYTARNEANVAWLRKTFQTAKDTRSLGIMIMVQANMFESFLDPVTGSTHSGFSDFIAALRQETNKYTGEVVLVSGDTHFMRVDKPMTDKFPACVSSEGACKPFDAALDSRGTRVLNFTRVEVPGMLDVHWVLCHVRPNSRNLFQFEFMIVPPAVPSGVTAVAKGPGTMLADNTYETNSNQVVLDGSSSFTTNTGDVTYSWDNAPGYPVAAILQANTSTPAVQFSFRGTYQLKLTVTDRTGTSATSTVTIRYS